MLQRTNSVQRIEAPPRAEAITRTEAPANVRADAAFDYEYLPRQKPAIIRVFLRAVGLTSDMTLLVLLSPCFAAWFGYRALRDFVRLRRNSS